MPAENPQETKLPRQTYENVLEAQILLKNQIKSFISGTTLENEDLFYGLWQRATLGIGARQSLLNENVPGSDEISVDYYVFNLLLPGARTIRVGFTDGKQRDMPAVELWGYVLMRLLGVIFGTALEQAARMSPEKPGGEIYV